jgi:hypothetical protein
MIILSLICILLAGALLVVMDKLARTQPGGSRSEHESGRGDERHTSPLPPPIFDRTWHGL